MRILLVAATTFEIRPFLEKLPLIDRVTEQLSQYRYKNLDIDVLVPGVGMVPTAYYLGRQLALQQYDLAVNAGIAGSFDKTLPLGSVVNVVEDCVPELGAEDGPKFLSVFDLGLADPDSLPYKGGRLINYPGGLGVFGSPECLRKLPQVKGITSNTVRGSVESIAWIRRISPADVESMEGAAFFFACISANVPCIQIRSISNRVEQRDKVTWKLDLALKNLNRLLSEILIDIYTPFP